MMAKRREVCESQYLQAHPETWLQGWGFYHQLIINVMLMRVPCGPLTQVGA